jgi:hypothetical protein
MRGEREKPKSIGLTENIGLRDEKMKGAFR